MWIVMYSFACITTWYYTYIYIYIYMVIFYCYLILITAIKPKTLPYDAYGKLQLFYGKLPYNVKVTI